MGNILDKHHLVGYPRIDGMSSEHQIYGNSEQVLFLQKLHPDPVSQNVSTRNYRQVILSSTYSKLVESIIMRGGNAGV